MKNIESYYASYSMEKIKKPSIVNKICKSVAHTANRVVKGFKAGVEVAKGVVRKPVLAFGIAVAAAGGVVAVTAPGCTFDKSGLAGAPDSRPVDDGSLDAGRDGGPIPDGHILDGTIDANLSDGAILDGTTGDGGPNPDSGPDGGSDAAILPDAVVADAGPDAGQTDAGGPVEICNQLGDEDNNGVEGCADPACEMRATGISRICHNGVDYNAWCNNPGGDCFPNPNNCSGEGECTTVDGQNACVCL